MNTKRVHKKPMTAKALYGLQNRIMHAAMGELGMPYEENKAFWLSVIVGEIVGRDVESLSELCLSERSSLLNHLSRRGTQAYSPHVPRHWYAWKKGDIEPKGTVSSRPMHVPRAKYPMVSKIHAILADMRLDWEYVDKIARKQFQVDFVEWLEAGDLHKVLQMLVIHQKRNGGQGVRQRRSRKNGGAA